MAEEKQVPCEVFSRIVGYLRPVDAWNPGKQQEWEERKTYKVTDQDPPGPEEIKRESGVRPPGAGKG